MELRLSPSQGTVPREIARAADRNHAHNLLDRLGQGQLDAMVHLLETMIAPGEVGDSLSNAERNAVAEADEWRRHNQPITHEEVLAEFHSSLTVEAPIRAARVSKRWFYTFASLRNGVTVY
jgi:hypothetical protein